VDEDESDRPLGVLAAALWCVLAVIVTHLTASIIDSLRPGAGSDIVTLSMVRAVAVAIALFGIARVHSPEESLTAIVGADKATATKPRAVFFVLALVMGLAACVALEWLDEQLALRFPSADEGETVAKLLESAAGKRALFVVALALVRPLSEELLFRGALFTGLARTRPVVDAGVTAVLLAVLGDPFSVGDPRSMTMALLFAAAVTYLRVMSGSVIVTIVAHIAFSADVVLVMARPDLVHLKVPAPLAALSAAVMLASLVLAKLVARGKAVTPPTTSPER
jgi:membrane protease YdiL (CAAX protease family)